MISPHSWVLRPLTAYRRQGQKAHTGLASSTDTNRGREALHWSRKQVFNKMSEAAYTGFPHLLYMGPEGTSGQMPSTKLLCAFASDPSNSPVLSKPALHPVFPALAFYRHRWDGCHSGPLLLLNPGGRPRHSPSPALVHPLWGRTRDTIPWCLDKHVTAAVEFILLQ